MSQYTADVAIVGAGIIGCAIAEEISRRGLRVVVFDPRPPGGGATQASAGVLAPYIEGHERGPLFDQTLRSLALYDEFVARVSADAGQPIEYRRCGTIELADTPSRARALESAAARAGDPGVLTWIGAESLRELEPAVSAHVPGGLLCAAHGYVVVSQLVSALTTAATRRGCRFEAAEVDGVGRVDGGLEVHAAGRTWSAGTVVVSAGSWTSSLDIAAELEGAVRPVRGQLVRLRWTGARPITRVLWSSSCYIVPWIDGTLLVGATMEEVGFDQRATVSGVRDLVEAACEILPEAWGATFLDVRVGLRPASLSGLPIVERSASTPGVVFATGHFRNGILLAPLTARTAADLVAGESGTLNFRLSC